MTADGAHGFCSIAENGERDIDWLHTIRYSSNALRPRRMSYVFRCNPKTLDNKHEMQ